jgi:hypothetical protein
MRRHGADEPNPASTTSSNPADESRKKNGRDVIPAAVFAEL